MKVVETQPKNVIFCDGGRKQKEADLLMEHELEVRVRKDEREIKNYLLTCTNKHLLELAVGRLISDGHIYCKEDIVGLHFKQDVENQDLEDSFVPRDLIEVLVRYREKDEVRSESIPDLTWKEEWIFNLAQEFSNGMPIHDLTWGTHTCMLAKDGNILFSCEDIGRHNAIDKAIGYAVENDINLSECMLYSSGRVPTDIVKKLINARIPLLVSKSVPTAEAIKLAKKHNITLICRAYEDCFDVY